METQDNKATTTESSETVPAVSVETPPKKKRGFAAMSPEKRAEISRLGGLKANALGVTHRYTSEEAKKYGRIGGLNKGKSTE